MSIATLCTELRGNVAITSVPVRARNRLNIFAGGNFEAIVFWRLAFKLSTGDNLAVCENEA